MRGNGAIMIGVDAFSPLTGIMKEADYRSVVSQLTANHE